MRLAHAVRVGAWILVGLNLLMAVGAIAIFSHMAPAIAMIIERNERSLQACEDMLALMAKVDRSGPFSPQQREVFKSAFERARTNITEALEPAPLQRIETHRAALFNGDPEARRITVEAIVLLGSINREAMTVADRHAQHLGRSGAWGVAFMAMSAFLAGIIFIRSLTRRVVQPLEEIHAVIVAHRNGETMRRCTGADLPQDVVAVYTGINEMLDQWQAREQTPAAPATFSDLASVHRRTPVCRADSD
ncbi:hypothetical protein Despr_1543 [Desulfobulbus propionicus DSM 2032]|jgi:hypothetical protein|uniref:HAMP domain-containing protein n=1 Tax=Desulfobulbus propionicus (strain ATCC 33891 / DSM 2032 / VKM B-1956 / 1pr3) TaxID=577650 RepID=A0A7U4DP67_DESPD|nr:hypothetical protein [Desulfobulbus propionicus]ADW17697.1 hypothetical protein Despr_1543 [Desulfobulbus propionicus DSM 2032]